VLSVPELLSAIPQLYSTDTLREWYNPIVAAIFEFQRTR